MPQNGASSGKPVTARRWALIYNPAARAARPHRLDAVVRALTEAGMEVQVLSTRAPGHATELARNMVGGEGSGGTGSSVEGVAAFGGDGTLSEVATGLLGHALPLAFLPGGTANVMARALGISSDPVQAARALPHGIVHQVRPGLIDQRVFLLMAGFGLDGLAVRRVRPELKRRLGRGAYVWSGLGALLERMPRLRMENEAGASWEGIWAIATRSGHYGGNFRAHPDAGLLHPRLGLVMVKPLGVLPYLVGQLGLGLGHRVPGVAFAHGESCRVVAEVPMTVQVDGDFHPGASEFRLSLAPHTLPLVFGARISVPGD